MRKIKTIFKKDPSNPGRCMHEWNDNMEWVKLPETKPTQKWDGTAVMILNGEVYKRYDAKIFTPYVREQYELKKKKYPNAKVIKERKPPLGAIPCDPDPDPITGHWPHWVKTSEHDPNDVYIRAAYNMYVEINHMKPVDGTYEAIGPNINANPQRELYHILKKHGDVIFYIPPEKRTYEELRAFLAGHNIEGIVFHGPKGEMGKLRQVDYGFTWNNKNKDME